MSLQQIGSSAAVSSGVESGCGHESDDGGPCSICRPPEVLVEHGLVPKTWTQTSWDDIELRKHHAISNDSDETGVPRPDPAIEEALTRTIQLDGIGGFVDLENMPEIRVLPKCYTMLDDDVEPPPPIPAYVMSDTDQRRPTFTYPKSDNEVKRPSTNFSSSTSLEDENEQQSVERAGSSRASKAKKYWKRHQRSKTAVSKTVTRGENQKFVIPLKVKDRGGRKYEVELNVNVMVPPKKSGRSRRSKGKK